MIKRVRITAPGVRPAAYAYTEEEAAEEWLERANNPGKHPPAATRAALQQWEQSVEGWKAQGDGDQ